MDLEHQFSVPAGIEATWDILTDVPRVARCMPGATLDEGTNDPYSGSVAVKVGAITVKFRGEAKFTERDDEDHRLVLSCEGSDVRGASSAGATVKMSLSEVSSDETKVYVTTILQLSGKIAQFGGGMLQDVSDAILRKFVSNLERELGQGGQTKNTDSSHEPSRPSRLGGSEGFSASKALGRGNASEDVIDLGAAALPAMWARYGPTTISMVALLVAVRALSRSRPPRPRREWSNY